MIQHSSFDFLLSLIFSTHFSKLQSFKTKLNFVFSRSCNFNLFGFNRFSHIVCSRILFQSQFYEIGKKNWRIWSFQVRFHSKFCFKCFKKSIKKHTDDKIIFFEGFEPLISVLLSISLQNTLP